MERGGDGPDEGNVGSDVSGEAAFAAQNGGEIFALVRARATRGLGGKARNRLKEGINQELERRESRGEGKYGDVTSVGCSVGDPTKGTWGEGKERFTVHEIRTRMRRFVGHRFIHHGATAPPPFVCGVNRRKLPSCLRASGRTRWVEVSTVHRMSFMFEEAEIEDTAFCLGWKDELGSSWRHFLGMHTALLPASNFNPFA